MWLEIKKLLQIKKDVAANKKVATNKVMHDKTSDMETSTQSSSRVG